MAIRSWSYPMLEEKPRMVTPETRWKPNTQYSGRIEARKRSRAGVWLIFRREFVTTRRKIDAEKCA